VDVQLKNSLGIDLGTSSVKIALYDRNLKMIDSDSASYDVTYTSEGGAEQSPEDWWNAIVEASHRIMERNPVQWKSIGSVGVVGQFSGTVPLDREGTPLRNAIIWLDSRGQSVTGEIVSGFPSISGYRLDKLYRWIRLTGGAPTRSGKDSISHILYLRDMEPDIFRSTFKFLEPKDYINFRLTGNFTGTYDSIVLTWITDNRNLGRIDYHRKLLKMIGIERSKFPHLVGSWLPVGRVSVVASRELTLGNNVVVAGGSGDMQGSLVGGNCFEPHDPLIYIGTSSWVTLHVKRKKTDLMHNMASLPAALPSYYFVAAEQESAGSAISFIRKILFDETTYPSFAEMDKLAAKSRPGSEGLIFLPWLYGERTPVDDRTLRASFYNLSMDHKRSTLIRSVMEGVAYNLKWLMDAVEKFTGVRFNSVKMAGGGASSTLWPQIISDVLQKKISVVDRPIFVNARGAAILSLFASGSLRSAQDIPAVTFRKQFLPSSEDAQIHSRNFTAFLKFYRNNRAHMSELNTSRVK